MTLISLSASFFPSFIGHLFLFCLFFFFYSFLSVAHFPLFVLQSVPPLSLFHMCLFIIFPLPSTGSTLTCPRYPQIPCVFAFCVSKIVYSRIHAYLWLCVSNVVYVRICSFAHFVRCISGCVFAAV